MKELIPNLFATGALLLHILIPLTLIALFLKKKSKNKLVIKYLSFLSNNAYVFAFVFSLIATLGSLFYSEILKFQPCILCWYQRIFMYPQPILLYLAIFRNERVLKPYLLAMNVIGFVIASYHYLLQRFPYELPGPCSAVGASVSCIKGYSFHYGYISIPLMAWTIFLVNIILISLSKNTEAKKT